MFGDYTLSQASEVLDTTEEVILKVVAEGSIPVRRQFLLFGPLRFDREFIDDIAPDIRRLSQLTGTTIEGVKSNREKLKRLQEETERIKENTKRIQEESHREQEEFYKQISDLISYRRYEIQDVPSVEYPTPDMIEQ